MLLAFVNLFLLFSGECISLPLSSDYFGTCDACQILNSFDSFLLKKGKKKKEKNLRIVWSSEPLDGGIESDSSILPCESSVVGGARGRAPPTDRGVTRHSSLPYPPAGTTLRS